jgi:hypothetical protein
MAMQYDVKSFHNTLSGVAVPYRTRLKGVVISPSTSVTINTTIVDNAPIAVTYNIPGTTVCTVTTPTAHGLTAGSSRVLLVASSGTFVSDSYLVQTTPTPTTFTVTTGTLTTSGNMSMYTDILTELDCSTGTSFYTFIPGEGVLAKTGIYVYLPSASVTTTIFYG